MTGQQCHLTLISLDTGRPASCFSGHRGRAVSDRHRAPGDCWREVSSDSEDSVPTPVCPPFLVSWLLGIFPVPSPPGINCSKEKIIPVLYML